VFCSRPSGRLISSPAARLRLRLRLRLRHSGLDGANEIGRKMFGYSLAALDSHYSASGSFGTTSDSVYGDRGS
jgi:hypothetical protein